MTSSSTTGVLARVPELLRGVQPEQAGAVWRLSAQARQLDAHVVRLGPGAPLVAHVEPDLDVLLYVTGGSGWLTTGGSRQDLVPGSVAWLTHGTARTLVAGDEGLSYLTVHKRRPGLAMRSSTAPGHEDGAGGGSSGGGRGRTGVGGAGSGAGGARSVVCADCGHFPREWDARFCARCGARLMRQG
ncbi:cupin domain-containing protein [Streptomyces sp. NPDC091292]|uniref:cupin domain-containing protein n=1 Tax=Streptomyces sp. NPDC091292 TaxID=3365991 RepID=UPI0037F4DEBB